MTHKKTWPLLLLQFALVSMGKADCPYPEINGSVVMSEKSILQNQFPEGSEVFLDCANGYEIEAGSTSIICTGGMWSAVELRCKKKDCGEPKTSPHMTFNTSDGTLFGAYAKPICERGYYLEGSSYKQCLVTGWSGKSKCSLITCEKPAEIAHGKIVTQLEDELPVLDDVIEYSCDANYVLVGNGSITCNEYGEYSPPPPTCEEIKQQTTASMATNTPTTTNNLNEIKQQTKASMTTNIPTTTNNLNEIKQQTKASMTTNIPTTTNKLNSIAVTLAIIFLIIAAALAIGFLILCLVRHHLKHKGSYDTGEELRTKEELLQNQSL